MSCRGGSGRRRRQLAGVKGGSLRAQCAVAIREATLAHYMASSYRRSQRRKWSQWTLCCWAFSCTPVGCTTVATRMQAISNPCGCVRYRRSPRAVAQDRGQRGPAKGAADHRCRGAALRTGRRPDLRTWREVSYDRKGVGLRCSAPGLLGSAATSVRAFSHWSSTSSYRRLHGEPDIRACRSQPRSSPCQRCVPPMPPATSAPQRSAASCCQPSLRPRQCSLHGQRTRRCWSGAGQGAPTGCAGACGASQAACASRLDACPLHFGAASRCQSNMLSAPDSPRPCLSSLMGRYLESLPAEQRGPLWGIPFAVKVGGRPAQDKEADPHAEQRAGGSHASCIRSAVPAE